MQSQVILTIEDYNELYSKGSRDFKPEMKELIIEISESIKAREGEMQKLKDEIKELHARIDELVVVDPSNHCS